MKKIFFAILLIYQGIKKGLLHIERELSSVETVMLKRPSIFKSFLDLDNPGICSLKSKLKWVDQLGSYLCSPKRELIGMSDISTESPFSSRSKQHSYLVLAFQILDLACCFEEAVIEALTN